MDVQVVSRRPSSMPPKHFERCACSVSRPAWCNSGWGLHFVDPSVTSQSSQRSSRFHKPAASRAALGIATTSPPCGSPQASFVRKPRRGGTGRRPIQMQSSECRVQNTGDSALRVLHSASRRPLSPTIFVELKPQQTGTGLLIRHGEVATTSGSTTFLPGRLIAGHRPLKASVVVRVHPRQPVSARW